MSEPEQKQSEQEAHGMSAAKRTALLRYMAILFAVAFLLVLLSYFIQVRNARSTISELNQTSASALQNAEKLQQTNRELTDENYDLKNQLDDLQEQLTAAQDALKTQEESLGDEAREQVQQAYDLLRSAEVAAEKGDEAALQQALTELKPLEPMLSETAQKQLTELKATDFSESENN